LSLIAAYDVCFVDSLPTRRSSDLLKEVVEICDDLVDAYGVVSEEEGAELRKLTKNRIIIFSIARDFLFCKSEKLEFMIENEEMLDRKSTRLNSSHVSISYAVFCLK